MRDSPGARGRRAGPPEAEQILLGAGTEGLEVDPIVRTMPAAKVLIEHSQHSDLLVVGSRGRGGFRGLVMASVSMHSLLHAHYPVTVVRSEPDPAHTPRGGSSGPSRVPQTRDLAVMIAGIAQCNSAGWRATNGWVRVNSRAVSSSRRFPQPRMVLISRTRHGCSRRN